MEVHELDSYKDLEAMIKCPKCSSCAVSRYAMTDTIFRCSCKACSYGYIVLDTDATQMSAKGI